MAFDAYKYRLRSDDDDVSNEEIDRNSIPIKKAKPMPYPYDDSRFIDTEPVADAYNVTNPQENMRRPRDPRAAAFLREQPAPDAGPMQQLAPLADRVDGNFNQLEQGRILKMARANRRPDITGRNETTGQSFSMPASVRVNEPKGKAFLDAYARQKQEMDALDARGAANDKLTSDAELGEIRASGEQTNRAYALSRDMQDRADARDQKTYDFEQRRKKDALELEGAQLGNKLKTAQVGKEIEDVQNPGIRESRDLLKVFAGSNDPRIREAGMSGLSEDPRIAGTPAARAIHEVGRRSYEQMTGALRPMIEDYKKAVSSGYGAYYSDADAGRSKALRNQILQRAALEGLTDQEMEQLQSELSAAPQGQGGLSSLGKLLQLDF